MKREIRLCRAYDFRAAWSAVIQPWLEDYHPFTSQSAGRRHCILVPSMTYAQFLKQEIVNAGINIMGIDFLAPGQCWEILHDRLGIKPRAASREDLHLVLSMAAEQFPDIPSARSIALDPSALMKVLDQVSAAGFQASDLGIESLDPILNRFEQILEEAGFTTAQVIDRQLVEQARVREPVFTSALVIGFDGRHWPVWNLLNAAASSAESATVCLFEPRLTAETTDQVWINSWEEACGEAEVLPDADSAGKFAGLPEAMESGRRFAPGDVHIRVGADVLEEARAIAAQAAAFLSDSSCTRLGIVFAGVCPLARETTRLLAELGIPHNDSLGHNSAIPPGDLAWNEWLSFQEQHDAGHFLNLLRLSPDFLELIGLPLAEIESGLRGAYEQLMVDDIRILSSHLGWPIGLRLHLLPEQAAFHDFIGQTREAVSGLKSLGGTERLALVAAESSRFNLRWNGLLSRRAFIRWLANVTNGAARARDEAGKHPFARVHVVSYDKAEWQAWSHLILAGLNRNSWPPEYRNLPFLGQDFIDNLNRNAVTQGSHGEGHDIVKPGKGMVIGAAERSALIRRQFYNIIESASHGICFTAARTNETDSSREWNPSDLLVRVHAATTGKGLSDEVMDALQSATSAWLRKSDAFLKPAAPAADEAIRQTATAFAARRDESRPFGPFEYALGAPPSKPVILPCTAWERAVKWPEIVWMQYFLGVEDTAWSTDEIPLAKVVGLWVHQWLHSALSTSKRPAASPGPLPSPSAIREAIGRAGAGTRSAAEKAFAAAGRGIPDWWNHIHAQAASAADQIAAAVADVIAQGWTSGAAEWKLGPDARALLPSGEKLPLSGRIDLFLARSSKGPFWIIDYKTGSATDLTARNVSRGDGLQILLYGLALKSAGMGNVCLALASPGEAISADTDVDSLMQDEAVAETLEALAEMAGAGIFGMKGDPREEFGFAYNYPLATLRINPEVLEKKWELMEADRRGQRSEVRDQKSESGSKT